jgi:dihydroorotate dehydrogenase (NAD+) catalytic subunit
VNVCGEDEDEYVRAVDYLNGHEGISAYELNISCPNVREQGRCPAQQPETTFSVVNRVKKASRRPVVTKLSPNVTDITAVALSAQEAGSDAVSLVNTFLAMAVDACSRKPRLGNVFGGLSGPAIKPIALRMVYQTALAVQIPVIGMGGIFSAQDAVEFLLAGASAVQVGTASFVDPRAVLDITRGLRQHLEENGIRRLSDIIGGLVTD